MTPLQPISPAQRSIWLRATARFAASACFTNIKISCNATIQSAFLQFNASNGDSSTLNLAINGEATNDAATFAAVDNNISGRAKTSATVNWTGVLSWSSGTTYQSPNIASLVQEIVNRSGWTVGNDMAFIIDGTSTSNRRRATSFNGGAGNAPKLIINFADNGTPVTGYTVRDKLIDIVDGLAASGNTPLQDTFYEGVQYDRCQAVDYGKVRGGGPYPIRACRIPSRW